LSALPGAVNTIKNVTTPPIPANLLSGLNTPQAQAVSTLEGPLMLVAGPGSGKTRVLTHRMAALIATGTRPWNILAVTFTNKAAAEMRTRLENLIGEPASQVWVSTFHSLCARLLRRFATEAGLPASYNVADADDSKKLIRAALDSLSLMPDDAKRYQSAISWAKNHSQDASSIESELPRVAEVFASYQKALDERQLLDFDDLLLRLRNLLRNPDVLSVLQDRFRYIMVDEYQDTNAVQYEIVRLLASSSHNICVVGDQDQSIYQWRGAHAGAISGFTEDFPGAVVISLDQNYRSTKAIVDVSAALIAPNPAKHRAALWTDNESGEPVRVMTVYDSTSEADYVARSVKNLTGTRAIIVRTNAQTKPFELSLTSLRVPYLVVGAQRFYDRAEVKDALAWLRALLSPADLLSLARAAATPRRGLGEKSLAEWFTLAASHNLDPVALMADPTLAATLPGRVRNAAQAYCDVLVAGQQAAARGPLEALKYVYEAGLMETYSPDPERVENLEVLLNEATNFQAPPEVDDDGNVTTVPTDSLEATRLFVESATLASSADADADQNPVYLITAHASKGREFDHVYVAGVEDNIYPHHMVGNSESAVAEERRLLYVACSRAKVTLTLTTCLRRQTFGEWQDTQPSRFLEDMPEEVIFADLGGSSAPPRSTSSSGYGKNQPAAKKPFAASAPKRQIPPAAAKKAPRPQFSHPLNPIPEVPPLEEEVLRAGVTVVHPTFGPGKVIEDAKNNQVKVRFEDQVRTLALRFAKLTLENAPS